MKNERLHILAPAKINLALHILGQTEKNYHLLDSMVAFADFGDMIWIEPAEQTTYEMSLELQDHLEMDENNLVVKAHHMLQHHVQKKLPCHIHLHKKLPMGGGIGGGSSDAAATLKGLNQLFELNLSLEILQKIGLKLGADVPVCLYGKSCYMGGIGEEIMPFHIQFPLYILVAYPHIMSSTGKIFQSMDGNVSKPLIRKEEFTHEQELFSWLRQHHNDLEIYAFQHHKAIQIMMNDLREYANQKGSHFAQMSGSGSCGFVVSTDFNHIQKTAQSLREKNLMVFSGKIL